MCRSVPQIEAAFTRTSTSVDPISGTATVSICKPRVGCIFRNAFIVAAIYSGPRSTHRLRMLAHAFAIAPVGAQYIVPSLLHARLTLPPTFHGARLAVLGSPCPISNSEDSPRCTGSHAHISSVAQNPLEIISLP